MAYTPGGYPFDNTALPGGNQEDGDVLPTADWNSHVSKVANLGNSLLAADFIGHRDMVGGVPDVAAAGTTRTIASDGEHFISRDARDYRQLWHDRSIEEFGITFDSHTDAVLVANSAAVQDALDWAFDEVDHQRFPRLVFPPRILNIAETVAARGTQAGAPAICCTIEGGVPFNSIKAVLAWYGDPDATVMYWESMNRGLLRDIEIDGRSIAGKCLHVAASTFDDPTVLAATSGVRIIRSRLKHVRPGVVGNGCIALGTDPALVGGATYQASEFLFQEVDCIPEDNGAASAGYDVANIKGYGIKNLAGGNCKNGALDNCTFGTANVALDLYTDSGAWYALNCQFGNVRTAIRHNDSQLTVVNGDMECNFGAAQFITGGGTGAGSARLIGIQMAVSAGAGADLIAYDSQLSVENSFFYNGEATFWLQVGAGVASYASVRSIQNNFRKCGRDANTPWAPFRDGSHNDLAPVAGVFGGNNSLSIMSWGDRDDLGGGAPLILKSFDSEPGRHYSLTLNAPTTYRGATTISAHAGGGQASGTALTAEVNYISTTASAGDSIKLPAAALGLRIVLFNLGANAADVFPVSGGQINALGANAAYSLAAGASIEFWGKSTTDWRTR